MTVTTVNFTQQGDRYYSDRIVSNGGRLVIRIEYEKPGLTLLERSILSDDYVRAGTIAEVGSEEMTIETNVEGAMSNQGLRVCFVNCKPGKISVMQ